LISWRQKVVILRMISFIFKKIFRHRSDRTNCLKLLCWSRKLRLSHWWKFCKKILITRILILNSCFHQQAKGFWKLLKKLQQMLELKSLVYPRYLNSKKQHWQQNLERISSTWCSLIWSKMSWRASLKDTLSSKSKECMMWWKKSSHN